MYYCVKTILLFAIFSLSTGIGILISKMYENRVKELRQFKNILNIIKTKTPLLYAARISFYGKKLWNIFTKTKQPAQAAQTAKKAARRRKKRGEKRLRS